MKFKDPIKIYDARWEEDEFTEREIRRLCESTLIYAKELGVDTVTISKDARIAAPEVMEIAKETAINSGFRTFVCCSPISTPQSYFFTLWVTAKYPQTMGITITASHNPANYIGMKITVPPVRAIGLNSGPNGGFKRIREIYHSEQQLAHNNRGTLTLLNLTQEYIEFSASLAGVREQALKGISVILDSFNGAAGPELYMALDRAGVRIRALKLIPNGRFPTGSPNPIGRGKMNEAIKTASSIKNSVVIGTDGDGDRLVFGDARGIVTAGSVSLPILEMLTRENLSQNMHNPKVVYDPKVNPMILDIWREMGITACPFRNGHSQIKEYMKKINAIGAIEESGHFYHRINYKNITTYAENSLLTILLFLKSFYQNTNLMDKLWELESQSFTTGEINYRFSNNAERDEALKTIITFFQSEGAKIQSKTEDGIDLQGHLVTKTQSQKWYSGYFRVSTNEKAILRSYITASDSETGTQLEKRIRNINSTCGGEETE